MILAISTNKGGVLKTSITTNLAGVLATHNKRVLIIDTDNQGNAMLSFGKNPDALNYTIYDVLVREMDPREVVVNVHPNIDILPSNDDMSFFEFDVLTEPSKFKNPFYLLRDRLRGIEKDYDVVLIDTPPNLGLAHGNVLSYADKVLLPFQPETYSMRSLVKMLQSVYNFKRERNPKLEVAGIIPTLVDMRTRLHQDILEDCRIFCNQEGFYFFETFIPRSIRFASSVAYERKPATLTDNNNPLVQAYFDISEEMEFIYGARQ